ncbi:hypothetical protein ES708_26207 [subsurface metagenome]
MAVVLSLLVLPMTAAPALARESLSLDPEEGDINDWIDIEGNNFTEDHYVYLYFSNEDADVDDDDVDDLESYEYLKKPITDSGLEDDPGDFDTRFRVPAELTDGDETVDVQGGTYYVYATEKKEGKILAQEEFTVIAGVIELDTEEGAVGTEVEISGEYFAGRDDITVYYDDEEIDIESGDDDTDSDGEFNDTVIIIPESTAGEHTIAVEDEADHRAEVEFTVEPEMAISATLGEAGDRITITGTGFRGSDDIAITLGGNAVTTNPAGVDTDEYGGFSATFTVPDFDPATYVVEASDGTNEESANFTILVSLSMSISPTAGNVGTRVTITGAGFAANGTATVKYDDGVVGTAPVASDKSVSTTFDAPASSGGVHTIIVTDGTNTLTATFTMESVAPAIPPPLKPEMGIKAESPVYFDWDDVTDDSLPVTYTLQVATDEDFTSSSIVLEKTGLTRSEYTVPEAGKLESTKKEAPYYWRVKATDGASNDGDWSGVGSFYVGGFSFAMADWLIYTLCGVGALLLGIVGFWIGRRSSYSYY